MMLFASFFAGCTPDTPSPSPSDPQGPGSYRGTLAFRRKLGGPGTSLLPYDHRVTAELKLTLDQRTTYDLAAGTATLVSVEKENGISNCRCTASNVKGTIEAAPKAFLTLNGTVTTFQFSTQFMVPWTCTGNTDPACANTVSPYPVSWLLPGEQNSACTNTLMTGFGDPERIDGSWTTNCPATPELRGEIEEVSWSLMASP